MSCFGAMDWIGLIRFWYHGLDRVSEFFGCHGLGRVNELCFNAGLMDWGGLISYYQMFNELCFGIMGWRGLISRWRLHGLNRVNKLFWVQWIG